MPLLGIDPLLLLQAEQQKKRLFMQIDQQVKTQADRGFFGLWGCRVFGLMRGFGAVWL